MAFTKVKTSGIEEIPSGTLLGRSSAGAGNVQPPVVPPKHFTSLEFFDPFTPEEQLSIATAAMQSAQVKLWYDRTLAASFITLADPRTEAGLSALVQDGLLTEERKDTILEQMQ